MKAPHKLKRGFILIVFFIKFNTPVYTQNIVNNIEGSAPVYLTIESKYLGLLYSLGFTRMIDYGVYDYSVCNEF